MTEIPEHLLKRSKERRAALGLPGGEGGDAGAGASGGTGGEAAAPQATAPAKAEATAPAAPPPVTVPEPPPPPPPKPAYVQAAESRRRIPYWAMPVIALLPVWAFVYAQGLTESEVEDAQMALGSEVYASCSGCHGANGEGGSGAAMADGEVLLTFPDPVAMMQWIHLGGDQWTGGPSAADYGDPEREGGPHNTGTLSAAMPPFDTLSAEELAAVTRFIREGLSGEAPASPEVQELYLEWAELAIEGAANGELVYSGTDADPERVEVVAGG